VSLTLDAQKTVINSSRFERRIDARERPWYTAAAQARRPVWTDIYTSVSQVEGHSLAINASRPIYDNRDRLQGVVSVILDLKQISTFLSTLDASPSSQIYINDGEGMLIGSSDGKNPVTATGSGINRLAAIDSSTRLIHESAAYLQTLQIAEAKLTHSLQTSFLIDSDRHFLQIAPFDLNGQLNWHIVVVVPESDFMAEINQQLRLTLWLCLLAGILSTGLSIVIGRWIAQPLRQLSQACKALAQGELDQTVTAKRVYELRELADAFNQMTQQLQESFTQLQILNQALFNSESRLEQFLEALPVGVAIHNQSGHLTYLNQAGRTLLHIDVGNEALADLPGAIYTVAQNIQRMPDPLAKLPIEKVLTGMTVEEDIKVRIDNQTIILEVIATPIFDKQGPISFAIAIFQDITARKRSEQHLIHNALHDSLTGLPNRNFLMERLKVAIERSQRTGKAEFALLFLDLDRFKVVNDSLGHLAGDDLLIQISHLLRETIRPFDVAARLG
ncbi:MAG: diguanylate cyclase, partial [Elainellaceae cyanobacterium]